MLPQLFTSSPPHMKSLYAIITFLSIAMSIGAETREWPPDVERETVNLRLSELPVGIDVTDPEDPDRPIEQVTIWRYDFNHDGRKDWFIDTGRGGTGGSYFYIFHDTGEGFSSVLGGQGGVIPLGIVGGAPRVEVWGRAGGGEFHVTRYIWSEGKWKEEFTDSLRWREEDDKLDVIRREHHLKAEQAGTEQPATRPESKSEGGDKPQPEAEGRSR